MQVILNPKRVVMETNPTMRINSSSNNKNPISLQIFVFHYKDEMSEEMMD
jgi:hypothetical protein